MKKIFLFDVDGTLTEPRMNVQNNVVEALEELSKIGDIGLVTGSNFDYIQEQILSIINEELKNKIILLPCNGTKKFIFDIEKKQYVCVFSRNLKDLIGKEKYKSVIEKIMQNQMYLMRVYNDLPLTGNFISYRESMINWCPIGRDANEEERKEFKSLDKKHNIREPMINMLQKFFDGFKIGLKISLGGDTSFDIFPFGWDKTFALEHFNFDQNEIFFIGDRCEKNGNDFEIYQKVNQIKNGNGIITSSPDSTIKIIKELIK